MTAGFEDTLVSDNWVAHEFQYLDLGDQRLDRRLGVIVEDFARKPDALIPKACGSWAKAKAAYRFFGNQRVEAPAIIRSHYQATAERIGQYPVVLLANDTTSLNYSFHHQTTGRGTIGSEQDLGIMVHDMMAFTPEGVALGLVDVQTWTRPADEYGKRIRCKQLPIEQKESMKWLNSFNAAEQIQQEVSQTRLVCVSDCESDVFALFELAARHESGPELLIRATHNRGVDHPQKYLWDFMRSQKISGSYAIEVPRKGNQPARQAQLTLRFAEVKLKSPARRSRKQARVIRVWAILAEEKKPPTDVEPICWLLLTTLPVTTLEDAIEKIRWYVIRWQIELFHKVLKSGCRVEDRQLDSVEKLIRCLMVDAIIAWRILLLTKLGREVPDLPCTVVFDEYEWKALYYFVNKTQQLPDKEPTLQEAIRMVAKLGGFLGRKRDGQPGSITIWRGLIRLHDIVEAWRILPILPVSPRCG
jgi:hypothetical protein